MTAIALSAERHRQISDTVRRERRGLLDFIRRRVPSREDAEDILQDVFYQFADAMADGDITQSTAWLYRVAGNRIIDWYRKKKTDSFSKVNAAASRDGEAFDIAEMLADEEFAPDGQFERTVFWDAFDDAIEDLPPEQREAFIKQELEGQTFREMSEESGVAMNTLISRKRYAVLSLREQLRDLYNEYFE